MSARDKLFAHLDPIPVPAAIRDMLLDRYRAEVLRAAADTINALPQDYECDPGRGDAAELLRRMADEAEKPTLSKAETVDACGRCHRPFDPADTRFDGRARHRNTPWCRSCVDRCHESTDAFHVCAVCRPSTEAEKVTHGGSQPPAGEITQPTAEIEFAVYGTITLSGWRYLELAPDYYGNTYMQIGGWLPEGWDPEHTPAGTQQMLRAHLHGHAIPHDLPVQVSTKGYGEPRRFMQIQWRKTETGPAAPDHLDALLATMREQGGVWTTRRVMDLPAPYGTTQRSVARRRLDTLAERGQLVAVPGHDRAYRVNHAGGDR